MYDTIPHYVLKFLRRKVYPMFFKPHELPPLGCEQDLDKANQMIYDLLIGDKPCMIARFGDKELLTVINYLYVTGKMPHNIIKYIQGEGWEWWWNGHSLQQIKTNAGFFPPTSEMVSKFSELFLHDTYQVDLLGSWKLEEYYLKDVLANVQKVQLFNLEPFFSSKPWTKALAGKKVLLVHPFSETILYQYVNHRTHLFKNEVLPQFDLITYKAVQSLNGDCEFQDWFEALKYMESEIDKINFDVAIIGCGAYGFPLAAHIKRTNRKAFHLGGVTQMLFGIKGKRWENPIPSMCKNGYYPDLFNDYWVRPGETEKPKTASIVEGGCYW